jgi:MarR family transcriptional regulator for hemolysin
MSQLEKHLFASQIAQLSRAWRAEMDRRLVELGLSQARWLVLIYLARFEQPPTQRELARQVGVEGPTLARLLDALEGQGLVSRKPAPGDRRAKQIELNAPARPLIAKIEQISAQLRAEIFDGIDEDELERCQQIHARILNNLEKA